MGILNTLAEVKMSILTTFGPESHRRKQKSIAEKMIAADHKTTGTITAVKTCWWIKVNTKAFRRHALDGAKFPHIIYFTYTVNGAAYQGSSCIDWHLRCPYKGETVTVFYDKSDPAKYTVNSFGASL